MYSGNMTVA